MIEDQQEENAGPGLLSALPAVIWQRRWWLIVPLVVAAIGGIVACFVIRPVYASEATVLIESQDLPDNLFGPPATDVIDQRIARARQRVLSRMELIRLIRAYNMYPAEQRSTPLSKIVDKMREDTTIEAVGNDLLSGSAKRLLKGSSTVALKIGFRYSDPAKAQIVAQQYVNRFLEVDASSQSEQAIGTASFLDDQANALQSRITDLENRITKIKTDNGAILAIGQQSSGDPAADAARIDSDIARLQTENTRLAATSTEARDPGVASAETALRVAQAKYSDTHPDVVAARAQLDAARRVAAAQPRSNTSAGEIAANRTQIASLQNAKMMLLSQSGSLRAAQARAPGVTAQVDQLEKQAEALRAQYQMIGGKLQAAQMSAKMENEQKGERLTLADPPVVPDRPTKPNRPMILIAAIAGGLGSGLALILLVELFLRPIRGPQALAAALGEAPLAVIADLNSKPGLIVRLLERRMRRKVLRA